MVCEKEAAFWMSKKELIPEYGKLRRKSAPQNIILTLLNTEMIPGGWISQREAANTHYHPGLVENNMEEK